jgi:hypothetical protein
MTIDDAESIYKLIRDNGQYPGDPPVYKIYTYTNFNGQKTYAIYYGEYQLEPSEYCDTPVLLWEDGDLTADGKVEFSELRNKYASTR